MLLTIDVGNTNTVVGLAPLGEEPFLAVWRLASRRDRTSDEWFALLRPLLDVVNGELRRVQGVAISSVVPAITASIQEFALRYLEIDALIASVDLRLGITVKTDAPRETGTDRIVNCAAAYAKFGGPTIIVDLGTATKIEAITEGGEYLGGVIAPGLGLTLEALASRAARLYAVELALPAAAIGANTVAALQSGVVLGHLALIEGMVERVSKELGGAKTVVLTGGHAPVFAHVPSVFTTFVPHLTLYGLRLIYQWNRE